MQHEKLKRLDKHSRELLLNAAIARNEYGAWISVPLNKTEKMIKTGRQADAVARANAEAYQKNEQVYPKKRIPNVTEFKFQFEPRSFRSEVPPTREQAYDVVMKLVEMSAGLREASALFTPFHDGGEQIQAVEYVREIVADIQQKVEAARNSEVKDPDFYFVDHPIKSEITHSYTLGYQYPSALPVNTDEKDFDSGKCDLHVNTAFRRGDKGYVVAETPEYSLFVSSYGTYGWIDKMHAASIEESASEVVDPERGPEHPEYYYFNAQPFFFEVNYKKYVLLPGDSVYRNYKDKCFCIKTRSPEGKEEYVNIPKKSFGEGQVTEKLDLQKPLDLQRFIKFLWELQVVYMHAAFDCSEAIRRAFLIAGIDLPKYSDDIKKVLIESSSKKLEFSSENASDLKKLENGVYVIFKTNPAGTANHVYVAVKEHEELNAFSIAFDIRSDEGDLKALDYPIGPHFSGEVSMQKSLELGQKFVVLPMALKPAA